jgi:hypothetical protein
LQTETQRTTSSNGTGDSNGSGDGQEENNSTKEVVMDMCNNVIMGSDKEQSKKFGRYPYP